VYRPAAHELDELVSGLLERQPALHLGSVLGGHLDGTLVAEEVGSVQHVLVQGVALDPLAAVDQAAQRVQRAVHFHSAGRFDGSARRHLVCNRADAADPGRDVGRLGVAAPPQEGLEEARRLVDP
jgi:hypothetical protein